MTIHEKTTRGFYVWFSQAGEGCDYTIGCGESLIMLKATNLEEAKEEVFNLSGVSDVEDLYSKKGFSDDPRSERRLDSAFILELRADVTNLKEIVESRLKEERNAAEKAGIEEEIARLQAKRAKLL